MLKPIERLALLLSFVGVLLLAAVTGGCPAQGAASSSSITRATVRGAILALTSATRDAMTACSDQSVEMTKAGDAAGSEKLWRDCKAAYAVARPSLIVAAEGLDAWTDVSRGEIVCAALRGARGAVVLVSVLEGAGLKLSASFEDVRVTADSLASMGQVFACPKS